MAGTTGAWPAQAVTTGTGGAGAAVVTGAMGAGAASGGRAGVGRR